MEQRELAFVTGASEGLGEVVARRLAREGYRPALVARRRGELERVAGEIAAAGGAALPVPCDITNPDAVHRAFAPVIEQYGPARVLVNSAGLFIIKPFLDLTPAEMQQVMAVHYLGAAYCAQAVLPGMLAAGRGAIVSISATAAWRGSAEAAAFAAAKFALRALNESLSREFGERGVHAAQIVIDGQIDSPEMRASMPERDPATFVNPEAIAETILHLVRQPPTAWTREMDLRPFDQARRS